MWKPLTADSILPNALLGMTDTVRDVLARLANKKSE
jgi:hypothetical protein